MRKKLILFTRDEIVKEDNFEDLYEVFGDIIDVEAYSLDSYIAPGSVEGDMVLSVTTFEMNEIEQYLKKDIEIFCGSRTILLEVWKELQRLPEGTKALVKSTNILSTMELTTLLIRSGLEHIRFIPYINDAAYDRFNADVVILPQKLEGISGTEGGIPEIELKRRRITDETYRAVALSLGIYSDELEKRIEEKTKDLLKLKMFDIPLQKILTLEDTLKETLNEMDDGVVITNMNGSIVYVNKSFIRMNDLSDKRIRNIPDDFNLMEMPGDIRTYIISDKEEENRIIESGELGKVFLFSKKKIYSGEREIRYINIFKDISHIEKLETKIRSAIRREEYSAHYTFTDIIGSSVSFKNMTEKAKRISKFERTVLIQGESGTGKEMIAQAMHNMSSRRKMPFVAINCAALSPELIESELFGYEEGTFTGAKKGGKRGLFEIAHNGTIFLDEIGTIPTGMQMKMLRVLQEHVVRRIGGENVIPVNIRVMAATNVDLWKLVESGQFRLDLYYRLNVFPIEVPPLRERKGDIELLIQYMLSGFNKKEQCKKRMAEDLVELLKGYSFPGNIRELQNIMEYLYYMSGDTIGVENLPESLKMRMKDERKHVADHFDKDPEFDDLTQKDIKVLNMVKQIKAGGNPGREKILKILRERGEYVSEYKLRKILKIIKENSGI